MVERRRWGRVKVPDHKLSCLVAEPHEFAYAHEFIVDNINPGGISFFSDKILPENQELRLLIKFPFTTYVEAGTVWGRVAYCVKIHDKDKYVVGIAFIRKQKGKEAR